MNRLKNIAPFLASAAGAALPASAAAGAEAAATAPPTGIAASLLRPV